MIRKIIKKNNNYVLNYRIQLFEGVILISLFNIIFPNETFFGLPMSYEKWKVIRSPHVNKKSMETFVKRTVKYMVSLIKVKNKKFFDIIINFFVNLTKTYMEIVFKSQEYWFILSWNKNKMCLNKHLSNISIFPFISFSSLNFKSFYTFILEMILFISLYCVVYIILKEVIYGNESKDNIKNEKLFNKYLGNISILGLSFFTKKKNEKTVVKKLDYDEVIEKITKSNLDIVKWLGSKVRRQGYPSWKHFVLSHITKEDVEKGRFNWLYEKRLSKQVLGLEKWIRIKLEFLRDAPERAFIKTLCDKVPPYIGDTKAFLVKYDQLKRAIMMVEDLNQPLYIEFKEHAMKYAGESGDSSIFKEVPFFDRNHEISKGYEIFQEFYDKDGKILDPDLVANDYLAHKLNYILWVERSLRYFSIRGEFPWDTKRRLKVARGEASEIQPIYWDIYDSLSSLYYKSKYAYYSLFERGRNKTKEYISIKIDPTLETTYKEELVLTYRRFWDFLSRSVTKVNQYEKYDDLSLLDKMKRVFQWDKHYGKYYVPINLEEFSGQTALFFDKIIKKVFFDPYKYKNLYKNNPEKTFYDFRDWVYEKEVVLDGLTPPEDLDEFLAGFSSFYNLSEITLGDKYWFKPHKSNHKEDSFQLTGDYNYYYLTLKGQEGASDTECVAVFKNNKWVDIVDFQSYLVHLRGENSFLMEREYILSEVSKYYELHTYEADFNRRLLWSENYSKTLSDLNIDVTKKENGSSFYESLLNDSWGIENSLMWPSETFPGAHKYSDFLLRIGDIIDQLGFDTLLLAWKWLSLCIFFFTIDYILYIPSFKNYNFVISYKKYRHKLNEAVFRKWGFSFFFYTEGISIFAQIAIFLLGAQYMDFLSKEHKKKSEDNFKAFNAMSDKLETPYQTEGYFNRPLVREKSLNRDYGFGTITNKQSEMWFLIKRIYVAWEKFIGSFKLLVKKILDSENSFFKIFEFFIKEDYMVLTRVIKYIFSIPFLIIDFGINSYYYIKSLIYSFIYFIINFDYYWNKFLSLIPVWYNYIVDKTIELILFTKDEILEFWNFFYRLIIDWLLLLKYYFTTKPFDYFQSIMGWWTSYVKEWYWHHLWWEHMIVRRFHENSGWFSHLYYRDTHKYPESDLFTQPAYWGPFYDFLEKTKLMWIYRANSWSTVKDSISISMWLEYNEIFAYKENWTNYYEYIKEEGLRNILDRELKVHESWSDKELFFVLFDRWFYDVTTGINYYFSIVAYSIKDFFINHIIFHFYKLSRIDWWLHNSAFSFIYYPLCSIWRNLISKTYITILYIYHSMRYYSRANWKGSLEQNRVLSHFKLYFKEIWEEILYNINFFIQIIFYPFIGLWWYFKRTYIFLYMDSVNEFFRVIFRNLGLEWLYVKIMSSTERLIDIFKVDDRLSIKLHILFNLGEEEIEKQKEYYKESLLKVEEEKKENPITFANLMQNKRKYTKELVVSYMENHEKYKTNDWKLSKVTKEACINLGLDFTKVNLFEDIFPLTPNERVLYANGFLDVGTRNLTILKKLGYVDEYIILEGILYEQGLLFEMDKIAKEKYVEDFKILWLPQDYYFEIPQIRLIKYSLLYLNEIYGKFVVFLFDYVVYGGWFSLFRKVLIDGPFILFNFFTFNIPLYYDFSRVQNFFKYLQNLFLIITNKLSAGYKNFIEYWTIYHGVFILPSEFKAKIKEVYFEKNEKFVWIKYILNSFKDHFYYWLYNVPYTEWKLIYTDFLEFVEVQDVFKGITYRGLENKYKLENYEKIRNDQLLNLDPKINAKINMWAIFYIEKWEKMNLIKGTQFELAYLLLQESFNDFNKLKNNYIEEIFELKHPKFLNKYNNRSYESHWFSKFQGNILLEPSELIYYYNLRIKYSVVFTIKFLFENIVDNISFILSDISTFLFSMISSPLKLHLIFKEMHSEFLDFKGFIMNIFICFEFKSYNIVKNGYDTVCLKINNFIKNIFDVLINKLCNSYIYPLEKEFNIGIESLRNKDISSFFVNFFYVDKNFNIFSLIKIVRFILSKIKEDIASLYSYSKTYLINFMEPYYIYFKFEINNLISEYFRRVHGRITEMKYVVNNNNYGSIGSFYEIPYLLIKYMIKDVLNSFKFIWLFIEKLVGLSYEAFLFCKYVYICILEQFCHYTFLIVSFFVQLYSDIYFLIMLVMSELIFRVSNIISYIVIDVCSFNSIVKYFVMITQSCFELSIKIIELINLLIWSVWNFDFTTIRIYFNMFFIQFYQYMTYGNWWWDNSFLLGIYKLFYPFFKWVNYYLSASASDSIPVLIRGDLNRGLPFLIGEEARKNISLEQKNNIKAFFNYQGNYLGYPKEFITLWDINKHVLDYYMYLEKSNMPVVVKKYFFNRYLYNTFHEAMAVCGGRTIPRYDIIVLFMDILTKNNKFERISYESDMGIYSIENSLFKKLSNLRKEAEKEKGAAYRRVLKRAIDEKIVLTDEEKEKEKANQEAYVRQMYFRDASKLEGMNSKSTMKDSRVFWFGQDSIKAEESIFLKEFNIPYLEMDKMEEHSSVVSYYKELTDAWDTYEFLSFNQKIYNFYLDTFGPSFAYLLYHFPGHSLQLNDSRLNYREKVLFLRNFVYTNESACLSNLSLVNRLNSLDFQLYMKQSELLSKYFRIDKDFRLVLNPLNEMRLWSMYTLGETMLHLEHRLNNLADAQSLSSQLNDYLEKNFGSELYFYEESEFDGDTSTEKDEKVELARELDFGTGASLNYFEYEWGRIDPSEGVAYSKMLPSPLRWIYETEFYKENKYLPTFFPSRDQSYSNINFLETSMESIDTGSSLQIRRLGEITKQRYLYSTAPVDASYGKDWGLGIISTDYDELLSLDFHSYADNWTWQQAFLNTYLCTMDFYYNYDTWGLNNLNGIKNYIFQKTPSYDTALIQGSPWLDSNEVDRIIRERMTNKPLCYDYWIHYEGMDSVSSSFNKFENLSSFNNAVLYDAPSHGQIGFQDPASPIMEGIIDLHHDLFFFMILVSVFVSWILFNIIYYFNTTNYNLKLRLRDRVQYEIRELLFDFIRLINYFITRLVNSLSNNSSSSSISKMLIGYLYEINIKLIYWQEKYLNESYHEKELEHILINAKINSDSLLPNNMTDLFKYLGKNDYTDIEYFFNEEEKKGYFISKKNTELYTQFKNDPNNNFHTGEVSVILNNLLAVRNLQLKLNDTYFSDVTKEKKYIFEMMDNDILKYEHFEEDFEQYKLKEEYVWFPQLFTHNTTIEVIWTIIPAIILIFIAIPSFSLLYAMDQIWQPLFTIKVLGNQWYWSYEYC